MPTAEYSHRRTKLHRASGINKIMSSDSEKDNKSSKEEKTDTSVDPAKVNLLTQIKRKNGLKAE